MIFQQGDRFVHDVIFENHSTEVGMIRRLEEVSSASEPLAQFSEDAFPLIVEAQKHVLCQAHQFQGGGGVLRCLYSCDPGIRLMQQGPEKEIEEPSSSGQGIAECGQLMVHERCIHIHELVSGHGQNAAMQLLHLVVVRDPII